LAAQRRWGPRVARFGRAPGCRVGDAQILPGESAGPARKDARCAAESCAERFDWGVGEITQLGPNQFVAKAKHI
jgi:hypothetical protein